MLHALTIINVACAVILLMTAVSRLNDISRRQCSVGWMVRRLGLLLVAIWSLMLLLGMVRPLPHATILIAGVTLCWLTTLHQPPWWRYISGQFTHMERGRRHTDEKDL